MAEGEVGLGHADWQSPKTLVGGEGWVEFGGWS